MKHVYRIKGTYWQQKPLEYGATLEAWRIVKGRIGGFSSEPTMFGKWVDQLEEDGAIPPLVDLILQPYEPTFFHRWANRHFAEKHKVGKPGLVKSMDLPTTAEALVHFFVVNTNWTERLLSLPIGKKSFFRRRPTLGEAIYATLNNYSMLQQVITSRRNGSPVSQPLTSSSGN